jgi:tetratricopeptide (TPR) repeat protein
VQRLRPNDPELPAARAVLASLRGRWDESLVALIRQTVGLDPQNAANFTTMADMLSNMGRFAEADSLFVRSWEISQRSQGTVRSRAHNYLGWTGDMDGALAMLAILPEELSSHPLVFALRASIHARRGEIARAIEIYEQLRSINTGTASGPRGTQIDALSLQGRLEARLGHRARAQELFNRARAQLADYEREFPDGIAGLYLHTRLSAYRGEMPEALATAGKALALATEMRDANAIANARRRKAEVLAIFGETGAAVAELRAVHEMGYAFGYRLRTELEWEPLRGDAKFKQLMKEAEARADAQPRPKKP